MAKFVKVGTRLITLENVWYITNEGEKQVDIVFGWLPQADGSGNTLTRECRIRCGVEEAAELLAAAGAAKDFTG